ncbi:MAG TPA: Ku protein, partial [Candidatus Polarisedimenticolia bacterium]|nr:Ku protein [Candidatus Polarisedimenticolia bacterium]
MAPRSIASLNVSFGLVSIPVKLYSATEARHAISFNLLHKGCGSRLKQQYFCVKEEVPVPREEMVKGYEFAKGKYVTFTNEEIKALEEEASQMIEIREFLPLAQVDPLHFERAYYLGPDKGGDKPYTLLSKAMEKTGRCAIASWAARGKQYLVLVRPFQGGLILEQLHYADELRSFDEVERPDAKVTDAELSLAERLIEQIAVEKFEPQKYEDAVKKRMAQVIAQKVEGQEVTFAEAPEPQGKIIDLMEALRASLEESGGADAARKGPKRAARTAPAKG